jgi:hypothetical protein
MPIAQMVYDAKRVEDTGRVETLFDNLDVYLRLLNSITHRYIG